MLLIIDLIFVSLWILFSLCNFETASIWLFPFMAVGVAAVFSLQLRERRSICLILMFMIGVMLYPCFCNDDYGSVLLRPFARMYDYLLMLFSQKSSLLEGAYHYLGNHGDAVPDPGNGWKIFSSVYIAALVFIPLFTYLYLLSGKKLRKSRWNWKKIGLSVVIYIASSVIIVMTGNIDPENFPGIEKTWWLSIFFIPICIQLHWKNLSTWCRRYIVITSLFTICTLAGIYMEPMASLTAIAATVPLFYYFVGYKWSDHKSLKFRPGIYLLIVAGLAFWTAQYGGAIFRIFLLTFSFSLVCSVSIGIWIRTKKIGIPVIVFSACFILLPSIALGYNQFACIDAKRLYNFTDYGYSCRGLLKVRSGNHIAIRDRFGYITPADYEEIETMGNPSKPFVKFKHDGLWGVYDLERQSVVVKPEYVDILPYDKNSWRLLDEYIGRDVCHDYFVSPEYYYRFSKCGIVSDSPFIQCSRIVKP